VKQDAVDLIEGDSGFPYPVVVLRLLATPQTGELGQQSKRGSTTLIYGPLGLGID
jgi:hypothetical protein